MRFSPLLLSLLLLCPASTAGATQGAAVIDDGYAGNAMRKILQHIKNPGTQRIEARVSLDGEGKYVKCVSVRGNAQAICNAAKEVGDFGDPPYGVPTDVLVSLWGSSDEIPAKAAQAANTSAAPVKSQNAYMSRVRRALRNAMYIPQETKPGTYRATVRLKCDASGKILERSIIRSSGDARLDRYILQGIDRAGKVETPPKGMASPMDVEFTLVR